MREFAMRSPAGRYGVARSSAGVLLLVVAAIAVAGCGGKKSTAPPTAPEVTVTIPTTTPVATTTSNGAPATTSVATGLSHNCVELAKVSQQFSQAFAAASSPSGTDFGKVATTFRALADKAPEAIRPQFAILADAMGKYADALKGVTLKAGQVPDAATLQKLQKAASSVDTAAVSAASQKISAWVQSNCHKG